MKERKDRSKLRRRKAAPSAQPSEAHLRELVETSAAWIWETDADMHHTYTNAFVTTCLGYQPEEFLALNTLDLIHPDDRSLVLTLSENARNRKKGWTNQVLRWRHKDGSWRSIESSGIAIFTPDGSFRGLRGVDRDITDILKGNEALHESEARFREAIEFLPIPIGIADERGNILLYNTAFTERFGYRHEDIPTIEAWALRAYPDSAYRVASRRQWESDVAEAIRNGTSTVPREYRITSLDGSQRDVEIVMRPVRGRWITVFSDITERKRAEDDLNAEREFFERALSAQLDTFFVFEADTGKALRWNKRFREVTGYSDEEISRLKAPVAYYDSNDLQKAARAIERIMREGSGTVELDLICKDGRKIPFEYVASIMHANPGEPPRVISIGRDITERKKAEERLSHMHELMKYVISHAQSAIAVHDRELKYIYVSEQYLKQYKVKEKDIIGKHHYDVFPGLPQKWRDVHQRVLQGAVERKDEDPYVLEDGTTDWTRWVCRPWYEANGSIGGLIVYTEVITERKRREEALSEHKARLDLALRSAHMGVWRWEINEDRRYFDDLTCQILGIDAAMFTGTADEFFRVVHAEDRERVKAALTRTLKQGVPYEPEYRVTWPDGSIHHITARGQLVYDEDGRPLRINGIIWDITEKRLFEEERLKSHKLESVGTLAGGIAHDFNNLLQGIFGYISMAKRTLDQKDRCLDMLEQAEKALHQSVSLTNQLLTFARGGRPVRRPLNLLPLIENAVTFALSGSRTSNRLEIDDHLSTVSADEGQISQVLQNLVLNADQAMPAGGTIIIAARNVRVPLDASPAGLNEGDYVEILIRDTGIGIPSQYLDRIFDPYFTTKERGSGLGLATSYSIIRNHDGVIEVSSEPGKGSTFRFYLPATGATTPTGSRTTPAKEAAPALAGKILVMDDEEVVRMVVAELITSLGYEVDLAEDGGKALELYQAAMNANRAYDVVILDLTIRGGMGGAEAMQKLLDIDPAVKVIVSSGYSDDTVVSEYQEYGFHAFLKKPYVRRDLQNVLNSLMGT